MWMAARGREGGCGDGDHGAAGHDRGAASRRYGARDDVGRGGALVGRARRARPGHDGAVATRSARPRTGGCGRHRCDISAGGVMSARYLVLRTAFHGGGIVSRHRTLAAAEGVVARLRTECTCGCIGVWDTAEQGPPRPLTELGESPYALRA